MFSAENFNKKSKKTFQKFLKSLFNFFNNVSKFFIELPQNLKQFSLIDFSKNIFEIFKRKIADLFFKIRNTSKEDLKNNFIQFIKYIFSREFLFSQRFLAVLMFFLTFTSIYFYFSKFRVSEAAPGEAWYNDLWTRRQKIVVTNSASAPATNFVAYVTLPGYNLNNQGVLNNDCTDIRVLDENNNLLNYWVDPQTCTAARANIYFQIPSISAGVTKSFYVYYGYANASNVTSAQTTLFTSTIPGLAAFYKMDKVSRDGVIYDETGVNNGGLFNNPNTFPEGYAGKGIYFDGYSQYFSTPITFSANFSKGFSLIAFIKPEGSKANGYPIQGESMGKMFNFENIYKTGATCNAAEYNEGDGAASCVANGVLYSPDAITQKKTGQYSFFYDFYFQNLTRPSRSVTFNGTTQFLYQNNPVNFLPYLNVTNWDFGFFMRIKPYGSPGETRTILTWGRTSPANQNFILDYSVCSDNSLRFILDYNNGNSNTLATPCLTDLKFSTRVSSAASGTTIAANGNEWINIAASQYQNKRYIHVNGIPAASDATSNLYIERENVPLYLGGSASSNRLNFKGEIDEYNGFSQDQSWFNSNYYTGGVPNSTVDQIIQNVTKKVYTIFGNDNDLFYQSGFTNMSSGRYPTSQGISVFNYSSNTADVKDFYQQYGGNFDSNLNSKDSFISNTFNLFSGDWYLVNSQFDSAAKTYTTFYYDTLAASSFSRTNAYALINSSGKLIVGAHISSDPDKSTFPSEFFYGGMDEVFIYTRTLSTNQLKVHTSPYNAYGSQGKSLWQSLNANLISNGASLVTFSQNYPEEVYVSPTKWYDERYLYRTKITFNSVPSITDPGLIVTFNIDTTTPVTDFKMNKDCKGMVVADEYMRALPFWVENCNKTNSKFYARLNPTSGSNYDVKNGTEQNIFLYYGNQTSTAQTYPPSQVFDLTIPGLEVAYSFEEAAATTTSIDLSGNARTFQWVSRSQSTSGAFGSAPYFNGSTNYGSGPLPRATILGWSGFSILGWTKKSLDSGVSSRDFYSQLPSGGNTFNLGNNLYLDTYSYGLDFGSATPYINTALMWADSNFTFTAYTFNFNSADMYFYLGNDSVHPIQGANTFPGTGNAFTVGNYNKTANYWTGAIDELRIFNSALSPSQIAAYTTNTVIGSSFLDKVNNTCVQTNNWCIKSFVTPSLAGIELLGKFNTNVVATTSPEEQLLQPLDYWKFDEGSGIAVYDSVNTLASVLGGYRSGTTLPTGNDPSWAPQNKCISKGCLYFDGLNDFVSISTMPNFNQNQTLYGAGATGNDTRIGISDFSYSFWIKPLSGPNNGSRYIISWGNSSAPNVYAVYLDANNRLVRYSTNVSTNSLASNSTLEFNKWYHISTTYDYNNLIESIYINGALDSTTKYTTDVAVSAQQVFLGAQVSASQALTSTFFNGYLDEFKIFKKTLNQGEVTNEYRKGLSGFKYKLSEDPDNISNFNLMAYYKFDEISGSVGFDSSDVNLEGGYTDSSLNNNQGLFNFAFSPPANTAYFSIGSNTYTNQTEMAAYSMWTKVDSNTSQDAVLLNKSASIYGGGFYLKYINSTKKFQGNICGTTINSTDTSPAGYWNHIVLESNSSKLKLYVNGTLQAEDYCTNGYVGVANNTNSITVGGDGTTSSLRGLVDEFKIYNNYLSNYQVKLLFNYLPSYPTYGNTPISWYTLDYPTNGLSATASDSSGNTNTLTINNNIYTGPNNWIQSGKIKGAYFFSMSGTTIQYMSKATTNFPTGVTKPYTFGAWVKIPNSNTANMGTNLGLMIGVGNANTIGAYTMLGNQGRNATQLFDLYSFNYNAIGNYLQFTSPYVYVYQGSTNTGAWHYVATTFDGASYRKLYLDAELVAVDTGGANFTRTWSIATSNMYLGNYGALAYQYYGYMDDAKIYSYARTQDQIYLDMRNSSTAPAFNSDAFNAVLAGQKTATFRTNTDTIPPPVVYFDFNQFFGNGNLVYFALNGNGQGSLATNSSYFSQNGYLGGAAYFTGNVTELPFASYTALNFGTGDFGLSFYINPNSSVNSTIANSTTNFLLEQRSQKIKVIADTYTLTSKDSLILNTWNHVFIQRKKNTKVLEMYINGVFQGSNYPTSTYNLDLSSITFKQNNAAFSYYLDELRFYNTVFDEKYINNLKIGGFGLNIGAAGYNPTTGIGERSNNYFYCVNGDTSNCSYPAFEYKFDEQDTNQFAHNSGTSTPIDIITTNRVLGYIGRGTSETLFSTLTTDTTKQGTISFWFNAPASLTTGDLFFGNGITLNFNGTDFTFNGSNYPSSIYSGSQVNIKDGKWHHININFNNGSSDLYYDGVLIGSKSYTPNSNGELWNDLGASIDEIRIYNYQRTPNQIAQEYSRNKPYVYLKFDECSSNIAFNSSLNIYTPLQGIQNGTRYDNTVYNNTGFKLTRPSGLLNFGNCLNQSTTSNWYLGRNGKMNTAFYFDNSAYMEGNDYHSFAINSGSNSTITFWINTGTNPTQTATIFGPFLDAYKGHKIEYTNGNIKVRLNSNGVSMTDKLTSISTIPANSWTHVAVTTDGTNYKLYFNGILDNSATGYATVSNGCTGKSPVSCSANPSIIGKGFTGWLDEFRIYNYPLTRQQIMADMDQNAAVKVR